jgi:hypothetical protein
MRHAMKWISAAILTLIVPVGMTLCSAPAYAKDGVKVPPAPPVPTLTTPLLGATHGLHFASGTATLVQGTSLTINLDFTAVNRQLALISPRAVIANRLLVVWVINPNAAPVQIKTVPMVGSATTITINPLPAGVPLGAGTTVSVTFVPVAGVPLDPALMSLGLGTF